MARGTLIVDRVCSGNVVIRSAATSLRMQCWLSCVCHCCTTLRNTTRDDCLHTMAVLCARTASRHRGKNRGSRHGPGAGRPEMKCEPGIRRKFAPCCTTRDSCKRRVKSQRRRFKVCPCLGITTPPESIWMTAAFGACRISKSASSQIARHIDNPALECFDRRAGSECLWRMEAPSKQKELN
jgi:hypothetical protein